MILLDDDEKTIIVKETSGTAAPSSQLSMPVQESEPSSSIDLRSFSEDARITSTADDQPLSGLPAMTPVGFSQVVICQELDALPGYHRNVSNRSSSVCP